MVWIYLCLRIHTRLSFHSLMFLSVNLRRSSLCCIIRLVRVNRKSGVRESCRWVSNKEKIWKSLWECRERTSSNCIMWTWDTTYLRWSIRKRYHESWKRLINKERKTFHNNSFHKQNLKFQQIKTKFCHWF